MYSPLFHSPSPPIELLACCSLALAISRIASVNGPSSVRAFLEVGQVPLPQQALAKGRRHAVRTI
jgi:hypothetical protein